MRPTDYKFKLYDENRNFFTWIASKLLPPYQYWLEISEQIFSIKFNFLRPTIYDLKTDESYLSFLSVSQKANQHILHFCNTRHHKITLLQFTNIYSPFRMTNLYTLNQSILVFHIHFVLIIQKKFKPIFSYGTSHVLLRLLIFSSFTHHQMELSYTCLNIKP